MSNLEKNILTFYKDKGARWLRDLPDFLNRIAKHLNLKIDNPFTDLSYNYTAPAVDQNGEHVVFKCGLPNKELTTEIAALKHFNGQGAVRLINANADEGWLLLERCEPGQRLKTIKDDDQASIIAVNVMQTLWKPIDKPESFPMVSDWLSTLKPVKPIPNRLIDAAQQIAKDLLKSQSAVVLLHGDLHHDNILSSEREPWLTIDPKGVIAEREYEVGAFMRNPLTMLLTKSILNRRLDLISEYTGFDRQRLLHWSFVQAVLAAFWCVDDMTGGEKTFIDVAEKLYGLSSK